MEAAGLAFSVAQTILAALNSPQLTGLFSLWGDKSELDSLQRTVSSVKAVLLDAELKQEEELSHYARDSIHKLKDALYDADDLLDEFATLAKLQHQQCVRGDKKFINKVRHTFSPLKMLCVAYSMSQEVRNIRKKLDMITNDATRFGFKLDYQPIRKGREETCSYVYENHVVGRENDKRRIVDMLLDPKAPEEDVPILAIVGLGGLGKTTLAQLVYNDDMITKEFCHRRCWVCVSDQDQKENQARIILANILQSVTSKPKMCDLIFDCIVRELGEKLGEGKYLLVLDDVWTEDYFEAQKWLSILRGSAGRGSRILVTTRSKKTSTALGCNQSYELQGLSNEVSWNLFETMVGIELANRPDLVEMGKDIVKKCFNVPLAIRVVGSFLRGQNDKDIWHSTQQAGLSTFTEGGNGIMQILKYSYYHLSPPQRSCFTYCAVFPEDYEFRKEVLISLWMAHDYVKDEGQGIEATAEYYFQILVQRCFFTDIYVDEEGKVRFKIHDLMHDMARRVAGKEIAKASSASGPMDKSIRHLYDNAPDSHTKGSMATTKIRSYFQKNTKRSSQFPFRLLFENWRRLRVLDLSDLDVTSLPDSIGELLHLRYLNLCWNRRLKRLPESLTKLINLQFLDISFCQDLKELPKRFSRLVNLRTLGDNGSILGGGLEYMPLGMEKMTCLTELDRFIVGSNKSSLEQDVYRVRGLRGMWKLRGALKFLIKDNYKHTKETDGEGGYLCNAALVKCIVIEWPSRCRVRRNEAERVSGDEDLLEDLQPHPNLKELEIREYAGVKIPTWAKEDSLTTHLPNLVKIELVFCHGIREFPRLGKLQYLKILSLQYLDNLEFIEDEASGTHNSNGAVTSTFFPSLETLTLHCLPKLKGWWKGSYVPMYANGSDSEHGLPLFPQLSSLTIWECRNLVYIPLCPMVEKVALNDFNERLRIIIEEEEDNGSTNLSSHVPKIRDISTTNANHLNTLPMAALQCLEKLSILYDGDVESLSEIEEVFHNCSSSLKSLYIYRCENLRGFSRELEYLTNLEYLYLDCKFIDSMPEVMQNLKSLKRLEIAFANEIMEERCKEPDGEDWLKIQHIPHIGIHPVT